VRGDRVSKIGIILKCLRKDVSEIKLKRTDTTLDLSQKAKRAKERMRGTEGDELLYGKGLGTLVGHMFARTSSRSVPCHTSDGDSSGLNHRDMRAIMTSILRTFT
jgi:hypothetical protein